jgi:hypothetical protein
MPDFVPGRRTDPTIVTASRGPENITSGRVVADMLDKIYLIQPQSAPLTVITRETRDKRKVTNYQFKWMEKDVYPRSLELAADSIVGDLVLDVLAGQGVRAAAEYVLLNTRTREHVLVVSIATDAITVIRGIGGSTADMVAGDQLVITAGVYPDGADIGILKSIAEAEYFNYTEVLRRPFGFTGRDLAIDLYGGKDRNTESRWNAVEHAKDIEYRFLFGRRDSRTGTNNHIQSFTGGLEYWVNDNVWDVTGVALTERAFIEFAEEAMRWGPGGYQNGNSQKVLFHSARWGTEINGWFGDRVEMSTNDKLGGLAIGKILTPHGTIRLVHDPIFDEFHPDMAMLLDMGNIRYAYLQGRDTKLLEGRQGNGIDGVQLEYLTDCGLEVKDSLSHAILKGLS